MRTASAEATERRRARSSPAELRPGDVVLVSGELGAGKTTFVRGALRALGVDGAGDEPDVRGRHAYDGAAGPVSHLDLYRLAGMGDEDPGLLDPFFAPDAIAFVEWPEHAPGAWPPERVARRVQLAHARRRRADDRGRVILGLDTATAATAVGRLGARTGRAEVEAATTRAPGERPRHASRLLALVEEVLRRRRRLGRRRADRRRRRPRRLHRPAASGSPPPARSPRAAGCRWPASRASRRSPRARRSDAGGAARPRGDRRPPRRGVRRRLAAPSGCSSRSRSRPTRWPRGSAQRQAPWPSGDGAVRFGSSSSGPGPSIPADGSPLHRVSALQVCRLGAAGEPADRDALLPDYRREPDAKPQPRQPLTAPPTAAIEIRRLTYADLPQVVAIERRAFTTPWSLAMFVLELSKPSGVCLAAEVEGELVGYLVCSRYDTVWHIMNVAVDPDRRRRGIATALLHALLERVGDATRSSRSRCAAPTAARSRSTSGFGFRAAGVRRRYYADNGEDAVIMWRTPATWRGTLDDVPNAEQP